MGKLQKISKEKSPSIFDAMLNKHVPLNQREAEIKQPRPEQEQDRSWAVQQPSQKLAHNSIDEIDLSRNSHSIRSARCAPDGITDMGGSGKFIGASKDSSMSVNKIDEIAKNLSSKEATAEEKKSVQSIRSLKQSEYKDSQTPKVGDDFDTTKGNSIMKSTTSLSGRYTPGMGKMSIFDNADFERVQDLPGEKMEKRESVKDNSWQEIKKAKTLQDVNGKLFDDLTTEKKDNDSKNLRQGSVDRLFNALIKEKGKQ